MKKILFNCVTPMFIDLPSAAPSILKSYLKINGYDSEIIYWNLIFHEIENEFVWNSKQFIDDDSSLYIYYNYLGMQGIDDYMRNNMKVFLQAKNPKFIKTGDSYYDKHMKLFVEKVENVLDKYLSNYDFNDILYVGFTLKLDQWFVASIIAEKIKKISPQTIIVVGGINTKETAAAYLDNFHCFDIAMWGEGEIPLLKLTKEIETGNKDYAEVDNILYRECGQIKMSFVSNDHYIDLSREELLPDYSDYFKARADLSIKTRRDYLHTTGAYLPIEGSRGCHWHKCSFCYLNSGYKYRIKSIEKIKAELLHMIEHYHVYCFEFLDNDLVGPDVERFNRFLDMLIEVKKIEPKFGILMAEIITKDLNKISIKKMAEAGIRYVQIGYESASERLLRKIRKKNTFASNLFFIKYAHEYGMNIGGLNVMCNLPEETNMDVIDSVRNLRFLRFFIGRKEFSHRIIPLCINHSSKYYKKLKHEIHKWEPIDLIYHFTKNYIKKDNRIYIFNFAKHIAEIQWDSLKKIDNFYQNNIHTYIIYKKGIKYRFIEKINNRISYECDFNGGSPELNILFHVNDSVESLESLLGKLKSNKKAHIIKSLKKLNELGLVYYNEEYNEIISVVNIDNVIAV